MLHHSAITYPCQTVAEGHSDSLEHGFLSVNGGSSARVRGLASLRSWVERTFASAPGMREEENYSTNWAGTAPKELSPFRPASSGFIVPFSIGQSLFKSHQVSSSSHFSFGGILKEQKQRNAKQIFLSFSQLIEEASSLSPSITQSLKSGMEELMEVSAFPALTPAKLPRWLCRSKPVPFPSSPILLRLKQKGHEKLFTDFRLVLMWPTSPQLAHFLAVPSLLRPLPF